MLIFVAVVLALAYAFSCAAFCRFCYRDDPEYDALHPWFYPLIGTFWPLVLILGAYLANRDAFWGMPR